MSGRRRPKPLKSAWGLAQESRPQKMRQDCFDCGRVQPNPSELFDGAAATGAAATGTAATGTAATTKRPPPGAQLALLLVPQASSQLLGKVFPETPTGSTKLVKANIWHF